MRLSPIAEYTQQYAIKFITAVGDECMTICTGHVVVNYWYNIVAFCFLPDIATELRIHNGARGNKQHVGIDSTQQRRHLSVENAVAVDNECVQYAYEYNNQPRGID